MYKNSARPYAVVIGRFQPFHVGHQNLLQEALEKHEKVVVVLGSARTSPTIKNPFTPETREKMIRSCVSDSMQSKLEFISVRDHPYNNDFWLAEVRTKVLHRLKCENTDIHLVGHYRDRSSYYLNMFPDWEFVEANPRKDGISATKIRDLLLSGQEDWKKYLCSSVIEVIEDFKKTEKFTDLLEEYDFIRQYKADTQFKGADFPATFTTTDAVVIQSGHVLIVKRKFNPGKGLLALPGGFCGPHETLEDCAIRELKEETRIRVNRPILHSCIKERRMFDHPDRSMRGRTFTMAFFIPLPENLKNGLPYVQPDDDASDAFWLPLSDIPLMEDQFYEDHAEIIRYFSRTI